MAELKRILPRLHEGYLPLTESQKLHFRVPYGVPQRKLSMFKELNGKIDVGRLEAAFRTVVSNHDILRTQYIAAGTPLQRVSDMFQSDFTHLPIEADATDIVWQERSPGEPRSSRLGPSHPYNVVRKRAAEYIDTGRPNVLCGKSADLYLYEISADHNILHLVADHIALDGSTIPRFFDELFSAYLGAVQDVPLQYSDYAAWEDELRTRTSGSEAYHDWAAYYEQDEPLLVRAGLSPFARDFAPFAVASSSIAPEMWTKAAQVTRFCGVSPATMLRAAAATALAVLSSQSRVLLALVESFQPPAMRKSLGCFTKLRPYSLVVEPDMGVDELLTKAHVAYSHAMDRRFSLNDQDFDRLELNRVLLNIRNIREELSSSHWGCLSGQALNLHVPSESYVTRADVEVDLVEIVGNRIVVSMQYKPTVISAEFANEYVDLVKRFVESAVLDAARPLRSIYG